MAEITTYQMLVNGQWADASDGKRYDSIDPASGVVWATMAEATEEDVNRAVAAAVAAGSTGPWAQMTPTERGKCLRRLGDLLADASEQLGRVETRDTGKMFKETRWQATYIAEYFHFYAGAADKIEGSTLPIDKPNMFVFTNREPLGVVAAIVPWNSQLFLTAVKIGPALAAGNTVVLKGSECSAAPILEFGKLIAEAGVPDGVVNIITGHGDPCGRALTSHPDVARVSFTGGPTSAGHVIRNTAENFAELSLELGGKSPFIVFDDADIDSAVNGSVAGIFAASGQSCVAGSRLYLHEAIADRFLEKMTGIANSIRIGDPQEDNTQMGPLCTEAQIRHIEAQLARAVEQGARIIAGGSRVSDRDGLFFQPTIIECPDPAMDIVDTELFGPVLAVLRFSDEDDVVAQANRSVHGLAAGIFTRDSARSMRMARRVRAGIVWVNTYRVISPIAEFGGSRQSGYGREAGMQAVYDYTRPKTIWVNLSDTPIANPFEPR